MEESCTKDSNLEKRENNKNNETKQDKNLKIKKTQNVKDNTEEEISTEKKKKDPSKVRCVHWPVCKKTDCPFVHPKEQCPKFPKCIFGTKCLYIHPSVSIFLKTYQMPRTSRPK